MTEPTTIEKIDAMLAALSRCAEILPMVRGDAEHEGTALEFLDDSRGVNFGCVTDDDEWGIALMDNITALLNGSRGLLETWKDRWQAFAGINDNHARGVLEGIGCGVDPLWQAFKEARDD